MNYPSSAPATVWRGELLFRRMIEYGGDYPDWAVGITDNLDKTIYSIHDISPTLPDHAYLQCSNQTEAWKEKQQFLKMGCYDDGTYGDAPGYVYI